MIASSVSQKTNSTRASMAVRGISLSWGMHILKETQTAFTRGSRRSWCCLCIPPSLLKLPAHSWSLTIETTRNFSWSSQENSDVPFLYIFWSGISQEKKKKTPLQWQNVYGKKVTSAPARTKGDPSSCQDCVGFCLFSTLLCGDAIL